MTTLGWVFVLLGGLVLSGVSRGRTLNLTDDLSDVFLAVVRGDRTGLVEALSRKGEGNTPVTPMPGDGSKEQLGVGDPGGKTYNLGKVKDHVRAAANSIGHQFRVDTIYGVGTGSVPNSDHPRGLALDFMVGGDKAKGDAIASYVLQHAQVLGVKYVIWYTRIWRPGKGWAPYHGPRNHKDHVHVSFNAKNGVPFVGPVQ